MPYSRIVFLVEKFRFDAANSSAEYQECARMRFDVLHNGLKLRRDTRPSAFFSTGNDRNRMIFKAFL